jgi:hypothetical protein
MGAAVADTHQSTDRYALRAVTTRQLLAEAADRGDAAGNADLEYNAQLLIEALPEEVLNGTGRAERRP